MRPPPCSHRSRGLGRGGIIDSGWFLAGFVVGFGEGGVDLVKGTVKVAVAIPRAPSMAPGR